MDFKKKGYLLILVVFTLVMYIVHFDITEAPAQKFFNFFLSQKFVLFEKNYS